MSWLYSIVFAGLLFSSQSDSVSTSSWARNTSAEQPAAIVQGDETEKFEQSYPLNANGRVSVSNVNGSITVEAWDRNEVKLEAIKTADTKERLSEVEIRVDARPEAFNVEANYDNWKHKTGDRWKNGGRLEVQFHLTVPRGAVLDEVETVNGSVTVSDFSNYTKISAVNGNVKAANLRGTANLSTVNGEVTADFDRLESGSKIVLSTVNGRVNLMIPSDSNATVRADSVNGVISNDFGLPVRKGQYVGRDLYGRLGAGDVHIKLSSVNGGLAVGRKNDGKSPSPATDLLPQKNKDEDDWDNDEDNEDSMIDSAEIDKSVAKAVKESSKDADKAFKEANKEFAKIKPKIAKIDTEALKKAADALNTDEIQRQIEEGMREQRAELVRMREADFLTGMPRVEKKSGTIDVKGVPNVTIDAKGCSVRIRGWSRQSVQYTVTQIGDSRNRTPVQTKEDHSETAVNIKVINLEKEAQNGNFLDDLKSVRIEVFVPQKSNLKVITNGEIRLEGVSGQIDLSGADEAINVRDVDGIMTLSNTDGLVRVIGFRGQMDAHTTDGNVYLEGDFDKLTGEAVDGTFVLTVPEQANASITSNNDIQNEGGLDLKPAGENKWRLGKGGASYVFDFASGNLIVRCASELTGY